MKSIAWAIIIHALITVPVTKEPLSDLASGVMFIFFVVCCVGFIISLVP